MLIVPKTVYKLYDFFGCCYCFFILPVSEPCSVLCIGPFLNAHISQAVLYEKGEELGIIPEKLIALEKYYASVPVVSEDNSLWTMLNSFCNIIWKHKQFSFKDIKRDGNFFDAPISYGSDDQDQSDILVNVKTMERRYSFENDLIRAVELGHAHLEKQLLSAFSFRFFEKRSKDLLRNAKNYGIIMNTLFRKAAERGGVHPVYLDRVSSDFALKIENMSALSENAELMCEMFRTYCRLVKKYSMQGLSSTVQNTMLLIDADLSAELTSGTLAERQGLSLGYLSTLFKKETSKTLTEYIRERRMEYATYLLGTTEYQIQTVALRCGIIDVHYFSKLFKKHTGKTPMEYRSLLRASP